MKARKELIPKLRESFLFILCRKCAQFDIINKISLIKNEDGNRHLLVKSGVRVKRHGQHGSELLFFLYKDKEELENANNLGHILELGRKGEQNLEEQLKRKKMNK